MNYTFSETIHLKAFNWNRDFLKELNALQLDQLRVAIKPHVEDFSGNVETFDNCFFPVYPNNEGGVEYFTFYKVLDDKGQHVFDFVRIEQTAGSFFKPDTTLKCLEMWAGQAKPGILSAAETELLVKAWKTIL